MKYPHIFRIVFYLHILFICNLNYAQYFTAGNEPFSVKWQCIETDKFELIFPSGLDHQVRRFARYIDNCYDSMQNTMTARAIKIPVIFHNQNVLSNGFVTWAPKRMEIYTTPSRDFHSLDWLKNLALHEYRHVQQVSKLNTGFTKFLSCFAGQTAIGLPVSQIPLWLNEGDAVIAETLFSNSGRGRLPSFGMPFKACILSQKKNYSYDKFYFGSYKDFVPDYYRLGFYLTACARLKYGKNIWNDAFDDVGRLSFLPYSFNTHLKKRYKTSLKRLYNETIDSLRLLWSGQHTNPRVTDYSFLPVKKADSYTSYRYIHPLKDSIFVVFKSSIDELNSIVLLDQHGNEKVLHTPGYVFENRLSCGTSLIVWDEIVSDPRWEQINHSVIKTYDLTTGKVKTLTSRSRYFSPCISKDDEKIAVVQIDTENNCRLVVLDAYTGKELYRCTSPGPGLINFPVWYGPDSIIAVFTTHERGMAIYLLDLSTGEWQKLSGPSFYNISQTSVWKEFLLFSTGFSGVDDIYALNIMSKELFQITVSRYGAYDPLAEEESNLLYYSQYTENGYRPASVKLSKSDWISFDSIEYAQSDLMMRLSEQEKSPAKESIHQDIVYETKHYSRLQNCLNIHSWTPFYFDPEFIGLSDYEIKPGVMILSQNSLSTSMSTIGISYENQSLILKPTVHYSGFFPVFDFSATIGGQNKRHALPSGVVPKDTTFPYVKYALQCYVPLRLLNNKYRKLILPEIDFEYENTLFYHNGIQKGILFFNYKLLFYRYLMLSQRDIYPKWGQRIYLTFTHTPFESSQYGILSSASGTFYIPGFLKHHSLILYGGIQYRETENRKYFYPVNRITLPRGYSFVLNEPLSGMLAKCSLNYGLPLMYPDLTIGSLAYIKRIRTGVFCDYTYGRDILYFTENQLVNGSESFCSLGVDLLADLHLIRFYFPFSLGLRISYLPQFEKAYPELLFNIDTSVF